jgi:hypothetical protein
MAQFPPLTQTQEDKKNFYRIDPVLSVLTSTFAENGVEIGITINVKGTLVSGQLISKDQYFKCITQELSSVENGDLLAKNFSLINELINERESELEKKPLPEFIHLKNARFFSGGNLVPSNQGVYWRGRLTEIDGFNLGTLSSP